MAKMFFIDLTRCTGCRGCQVACKQWKQLPAESTTNTGSHANPPDLSAITLKTVHMRERGKGRDLELLFFPEQCRHCKMAPCMSASNVPGAVVRDDETGAVLFTPQTADIRQSERVRRACPYDIPRMNEVTGEWSKCDMCIDRVREGIAPACVQTCPTGAMCFGDEDDMLALAKERLEVVRTKYPEATLGDTGMVRVIYLYARQPEAYHPFATFAVAPKGTTRRQLFASLRNAKLAGLALVAALGLAVAVPAIAQEERDLKRIGEVFRTPISMDSATNSDFHVVFNHTTHKGIKCAVCHHEVTTDNKRYVSCAVEECHSNPDRTDTSEQSRFLAYHAMDTDRSCYGCHFKSAGRFTALEGCAPCHSKAIEAQHAKAAQAD